MIPYGFQSTPPCGGRPVAGRLQCKQASLLGFRRVYVWDITQTEGAPLPEPEKVTGDVGAYLDRLRDYIVAQGITLVYDESIAPAQGAAFGTTIKVLPGQDKAEEFSTLVHELAHLALKHTERRTAITKTVRETEAEAEAVAFAIGKAIGLTTSIASADYIQLYHGNAALLTESLEKVQQTAAVILAALRTEESVSQVVPETTESNPEPACHGGRRSTLGSSPAPPGRQQDLSTGVLRETLRGRQKTDRTRRHPHN